MNLRKSTSAAVVSTIAMTVTMLLASAAQSQTATTSSTSTTTAPSVKSGVVLPANRNIFALTSDNAIYVLRPRDTQYQRLGRINTPDGSNIIGIDFRPADKSLTKVYALGDRGTMFTVELGSNPFTVTRVSSMNPQFTGGFGNVMDFNPVANALRVMGSNDQNLAVVNGADGTSLSQTVAQTKFAYAAGDVNAGKDPEIVGGAYNNNFAGATATIFYMIDHAQDTLVTISTKTATGSSNTAGGQLQTIGTFVDTDGQVLNMSPTTDFDIYTDANGVNFLVGQTTRLLFSIDLSQVNPNLQLGQTQRIVVRRGPAAPLPTSASTPLTGGVFDIAIPARTTP